MLPNFIFIGPGKSGSTWIYEALRVHPEVFVPKAKDLYFFDKNFHKGIEWYESFFKEGEGKKAAGELSHDYLFSKEACERIRRATPHAKLIACIRNPYERTFSTYMFTARQGLIEGKDTLEDAIKKYPVILKNSLYAEPLELYMRTFGRNNILILRFEELSEDPASFISRIYSFIGVDATFKPTDVVNRKVLPAAKPRSRLMASIAKRCAMAARKLGFPNLVGAVKISSFVQRALYVPYSDEDRPMLSEKDRDFLKKYFEPEITSLEKLLGEDFSRWRC